VSGSFTVTISNLSGLLIGGSKRAEAAEISNWVETGLTQLVAAEATSITLKDRSGNTAGTMSWTPVNTS
jgi:hypothetical protein